MASLAGFREFYNYVGGAEAHVHYSISSRADLMIKGGMNADGTVPVTEIWRTFDKNIDPSIASLEDMIKVMGKDKVKKAFDNGDLSRTFLTNMEAAHLSKIATDICVQTRSQGVLQTRGCGAFSGYSTGDTWQTLTHYRPCSEL